MVNPFPNKPWFLRVCCISLLKTLREKEKLLVTSNLSFFLSVFYPFQKLSAIFIKFENVVCKLFHFGRVQNVSFGKWLTSTIHNSLSKEVAALPHNYTQNNGRGCERIVSCRKKYEKSSEGNMTEPAALRSCIAHTLYLFTQYSFVVVR